MSVAGAVLLIVVLLACWSLNLFGLPGNWLMLAAVVGYVLLVTDSGRVAISWPIVAALAVLAAVGELIEFLASAWGVARQGGSRRGAALALVGAVVGAILGAFVGVPIPVVGSIVAALFFASAGALLGAMLGEHWKGRGFDESWKIGKAAFWGRLFGTLGKILTGSVMLAVAAIALLV